MLNQLVDQLGKFLELERFQDAYDCFILILTQPKEKPGRAKISSGFSHKSFPWLRIITPTRDKECDKSLK